MRRALTAVTLLILPVAFGQDAGEQTDLAQNSPAQNVRGGNVQARRPGSWVQRALSQHRDLIDQRVNTPRFGGAPTDGSENTGGGSTTGGSTQSSDLGGLLDLADQFGGIDNLLNLGGSLGLGGSIDALGGVLGGSSSNTQTGTSTTSTGRAADGRSQLVQDSGDAFELSDKDANRAQAAGDTEPPFRIRLADSLLTTFFTAVAVGFQSQVFIDDLKDFLRPMLFPPPPVDGGGGNGGGGGGAGDGNIEDLPPGDGGGGGGDGGSII